MTTQEVKEAPGGITFIVVLAYIGFIFEVLAGILIMIDADQASQQLRSGMTENQLMGAGIATVVIGVIGILLTGALARGSNVVRILFGIWVALQVAGGFYAVVSHDGVRRGAGIVPLVFGIVVLYLLFNQRAHDFFAKD
jgi:hypothetical protein